MSQLIPAIEFGRRLNESGLLSGFDPRSEAGLAEIADGSEIARVLVDSGRLTPYQAEEVLANRASKLFVGSYTIQSRIGTGGMGTVFKARHRLMNRLVALKVLSPATSGQNGVADRFLREVEAIAKLHHPNIVMAFDAGESQSGLYLVMEYVDGRDLSVEVNKSGALSVADAVDATLQAARGLAYAHSHGIVHRDVKPANLLRDAFGTVKVADLGLARLNGPENTDETTSLTHAGSILGTPDYMAPEQALDSTAVDGRVDIYSLGCSLYFLLNGRPMYTGGSLMAILLKHRDASIPSLLDDRRDVPAELDAIHRRMTSKKPEDRFETMDQVVKALEELRATVRLSETRPAPPQAKPVINTNDETVAAGPGVLEDSGASFNTSSSISTPTPSDVRRISDLRVVLVEPSGFQAKVTRRFLHLLEIEEIHDAHSAREALDLAHSEAADVIVSSMHLQDMTGLQLADAVHADASLGDVGFILASSDHDSVVSLNLEGPAVVALPKPFDLKQLANALAQATGRVVEGIMG